MDTDNLRQNVDGAIKGATGALKNSKFRVAVAAIPVVMVNATAFTGQFAFLNDHLAWPLALRILFAATLETVAIYIAFHAHVAQMEDDSALRLKLSAYAFAAVIGAMNYSHYAVHSWKPTFMGVALGLLSLSSPWLWGIHSRRASRDRLRAMGLIEARSVRLGSTRWLWHAIRSMQTMYHATWVAENDPQRAISLYETSRQARRARKEARQALREARHADMSMRQQRTLILQDRALARQAQEAGELVQDEHPAPSAPAVAAPGAPALSQGAPEVIPGTNLNGNVVRAIAPLAAAPAMSAKHDIDPERTEQAELYLAGLPVDKLPSERALAAMLCDENHDHRRQAKALLKARRDAGDMLPGLSQLPVRPRLTSTDMIASPVSNLPGGNQAHG